MTAKQNVHLLLNEDKQGHGDALLPLVRRADRLECMVAFATFSGFKMLTKELGRRLRKGLQARFAIGLDFYHTDPRLLRHLLTLSNKYGLQLYISHPNKIGSSETFHPKIYAVSTNKGSTVLIGSANLTNGGLHGNYEASAWVDDPEGSLMRSVTRHMDNLIEWEVIVTATKERIDSYERRRTIFRAQHDLADRRAKRAFSDSGISKKTLHDYLLEMKESKSAEGFDSQARNRNKFRKMALPLMRNLSSMDNPDRDSFLKGYENLINCFHSGGLNRKKTDIAKNGQRFVHALTDILGYEDLHREQAFQTLLHHFLAIPGAGVNVLTEILHTIDNRRFAVMNQNAVNGLRLANIYDFPIHPTKLNVKAKLYTSFCEQADIVRKDLGLNDFTELDALFNYAYWKEK